MEEKLSAMNSSGASPDVMEARVIQNPIPIPKKPNKWKVIIKDDKDTAYFIVILILTDIFQKNKEDIVNIIKAAEKDGQATIGIYSFDIASSLEHQAKLVISFFGVPLEIFKEEIKN